MDSKRNNIVTNLYPDDVAFDINEENNAIERSVQNNYFEKRPLRPGDVSRLPEGPKKKRGAFQLVRAALILLRPKGKRSKSLQVEVASKEMLNKMVGSMRPLHLQNDQSPPRVVANSPPPPTEHFKDVVVHSSPVSPLVAYSPSCSSSSIADDGTASRYASALNLRELDASEDEDEDEDAAVYNYQAGGGDELIDSKAEEFIAQFYQQMKIQNHNEKARRAKHQGRI